LRLNISGSAALPTPTKKAWNNLSSGNVLLERYGMTEVGMALSCSLPFSARVDGSVGWPLPGVEVRLVDTDTGAVIKEGEELDSEGRERDGEIQLRGPTTFKEYWRNPEATKKEHVEGEDGRGRWFKTGDVAVRRIVPRSEENGIVSGHTERWDEGPMYFIRGRLSADIIKSGGEKVSALEVERELLSLPQIAEAAVVAVPSGKWGQKVGAVVILRDRAEEGRKGRWGAMDMRRALKERLASYKIPQVMKVVESIPRNAMGKSKSIRSTLSPDIVCAMSRCKANWNTVNKKQLVKEVFQNEASGDEM
jgi:acyl-CoA synthetase (AMP-forming)/AMP-acid ligase II